MPDAIAELVSDGTVTTIALAVLGLELVCILVRRRRTRSGFFQGLTNVAAGACLVLALRSALMQSPPEIVAVWLGLGLIAHLGEIAARYLTKP
ncbi:MAG: hypothetical protein JNL61_12270 [Rhizobiaceae bacterium]|nr:hypothetical protein [Rhizobiaceae bacterium]